MTIRVADYIAQHIRDIGVRTAFMLAGGGMMHLVDAVGRTDGLGYICNHHEQASAIAADAYARLTGSLGVCYATSGPGSTNILTGLMGAWQDSSPVLFITGQSKVAETIRGSGLDGLRQFGTFEVDIVPIVKSCTKYAVMIDDARTARYNLEKAVHLATSGRPGPVLLDIPLDIQGALIDPDSLPGYDSSEDPVATTDDDTVARVIDKIRSAERPLILAGYGVRAAAAVPLFLRLVEEMGIPVVTTQLGKDILPYNYRLFVGHPGVKGDRAGNFAIQNADLILSIGCSLHTQTTGYEFDQFAIHAYKIQIDPDESVLRRENVGVAWKVKSDIVSFMEKMVCIARQVGDNGRLSSWRERCTVWKDRYAVMREPHHMDDGLVNYYEFVNMLSDMLNGDEAICTDAGSAFYVMGQAFKISGVQRFISSGSMGAMGFALPASIGAAMVQRGEMTVCVTGDGSFHLNIHELQTLSHNRLNVKIFVVNNGGYLSIRNTQKSFFNGFFVGSTPDSGVSLPPLDKIADAYGLPFLRCEERAGLRDAIHNTLQTEGPVICEIMSQTDQHIIPTVSSVRLPSGGMQSKPLHDMYPFLGEEELRCNMGVDEH